VNIYKVSAPCGELKVHRVTDLFTKFVYMPLPDNLNSKPPKRSTHVSINRLEAGVGPQHSTEFSVSTSLVQNISLLLHSCIDVLIEVIEDTDKNTSKSK
jgi:hypothetical protein